MKNIFFKSSAIVGLLILASGCNDNFLNRRPLDAISSDTYWNVESDLSLYNNGLYDILKDDEMYPFMMGLNQTGGVRFNGGIWWEDQYSDNLASTNSRSTEYFKVRTGKHVVPVTRQQNGYGGWELIRAINFGLENYDRAKIDQSRIDWYKGEARLFRGWFYARLVNKYGDVQYFDKPLDTSSPELFKARDSRIFVMDKVLEDLNFAIDKLPSVWQPVENPGRVDKMVALAVKSRICLFEGTWRKYHGLPDAEKWLNESVSASNLVMTTGGFSLYKTGKPEDDYRYALSSFTQANNPETIYWRKYVPLVNGHFASRLFWNYNGGATKSFVEDFLCTDGKPITLSSLYAGDAKIEDVFVNRDLRLRQCVLNPADKVKLNYSNDPTNTYPRLAGMGGRNTSTTGYHVVKQWNAVDELLPTGQQSVSPPMLRLGEVFLNYAEAKAELGTITQTDLDNTINKLRERAGFLPAGYLMLTNVPNDPRNNTGVSPLIYEIRRERRVELFLEGFRYDDLRRWKLGKVLESRGLGMRLDAAARLRYKPLASSIQTTDVNGVPYIDVWKGTPYDNAVFDESKHYLWPIQIEANTQNPAIKQNPGWPAF